MSRRPLASAGVVHGLVYRDLNDNGIRDPDEPLEKGVAAHDRDQARPSARPTPRARSRSAASAPSPRSRSGSTRPASMIPCWSRGRRCRSSFHGRAYRPRCRSGSSAAATSKARWSRTAGSASKGSISSWSTDRARSSPPRAPTSTASSCSNACPTAIIVFAWPRARPLRRRIAADIGASVTVTADKSVASAGRDPRRAGAEHRVGRSPDCRTLTRARPTCPDMPLSVGIVRNPDWCGREDSNFHGLAATATSTLRVYQFRHDRTS